MKKLFTLTLGLAFATFAYSQSERMVLVEEGTNASCGPCAAQNPDFHALLDANPDNVIAISYQVWWPGYDPMYEDNEADVDVRVPYYGIQGAPTAVINGVTPDGDTPGFDAQWYAGAPGGYSQQIIDDMAAIPASFDIDIMYDYNPDGINIEATATCTQDVSGDLRLHVVVVEKHIYFDSAPGSNGEDEFYRVMKKMLPSADGLEMADSYTVGETMTSTQSWDLSTVYDMDEVAVIAFVQDNDTKEVLQAQMADDGVFAAIYANDPAAISSVDPGTLCESMVNPMVEIRNHGSETLTSLDIEYDINGTTGTYEWTGSLEFYEAEMVELGDIDFTEDTNNNVSIMLANPNGSDSDENADNNDLEYSVNVAEETTSFITLTLLLDDYPAETEWIFTDENGDEIASGGPYAAGDANDEIVEQVQMGDIGCYKFEIMDSYGDGLNGAAWGGTNGSYSVEDTEGVVILSGGGADQWSSESTKFVASSIVSGIEDVLATESFNLFPNPSAGNLNVELELLSTQKVTIDVYDMVGKIVFSEDFGTMSAGYSLKALDVNQLNTGVYMMNVNVGENSIVSKFVVKN